MEMMKISFFFTEIGREKGKNPIIHVMFLTMITPLLYYILFYNFVSQLFYSGPSFYVMLLTK